jgi:hypothetical protein
LNSAAKSENLALESAAAANEHFDFLLWLKHIFKTRQIFNGTFGSFRIGSFGFVVYNLSSVVALIFWSMCHHTSLSLSLSPIYI